MSDYWVVRILFSNINILIKGDVFILVIYKSKLVIVLVCYLNIILIE